jgi:hypothetical protein
MYLISENRYLLLDKTILIDHIFYYTINSFWFNFIKPNNIINEKQYYGIIGKFYESYICNLINESYNEDSSHEIKQLNELQIEGKNTIDLGDFHIYYKNKIALGEIKSTNFGSKFKYDPDILFADEKARKRFLKDFGISQLVDTIVRIVNDPSLILPGNHVYSNYEIYPIIVFHERMFQVPFANLEFKNCS